MKKRKNQNCGPALIFSLVICLGFSTGLWQPECAAQDNLECSNNKISLQKETTQLMKELNDFNNEIMALTDPPNALFTDQSIDNICKYARQYHEASTLLDELDKLRNCWQKLITSNPNEKIYYVFLASVRLAMYSIYAQSNQLLTFLKVYEQSSHCHVTLKDDIKYDKLYNRWNKKTKSMLNRAKGSIKHALSLDDSYEDALIIEAQILALQGKYPQSDQKFQDLVDELDLFKDRRSYLNSWKAFIELSQNSNTGSVLLKDAAAFAEPETNMIWAELYQDALEGKESKWIQFQAVNFNPLDKIKLQELKKNMQDLTTKIRQTLKNTFAQIPKSLSKDIKIEELAETNPLILLSTQSDGSDENLRRYVNFLYQLHTHASALIENMNTWNELARSNAKSSYYFLFNKSSAGLVLLNMLNSTSVLVQHPGIKRIKDFTADWEKWSRNLDSLSGDIQSILAQQPDFVPVHFLVFEYNAIATDITEALKELDALASKIKKLKKIKVLKSQQPIDIDLYIAAWKSYLSMKQGNMSAARQFMEAAGNYRGYENWKNDQEKLIYLEEYLNTAK